MAQHAAAAPSAQMRIACSSIVRGRLQLRTTWGTVQEASALLDVLHVFQSSTVHEIGLCMLDPLVWGFAQSELPPVGSSPDALIYHPPCPHCGAGSTDAKDANSSKQSAAAQALASDGNAQAGVATGAAAGCDCQHGLALPGQWEVVEVKNHCPFVRSVRARSPWCIDCATSRDLGVSTKARGSWEWSRYRWHAPDWQHVSDCFQNSAAHPWMAKLCAYRSFGIPDCPFCL